MSHPFKFNDTRCTEDFFGSQGLPSDEVSPGRNLCSDDTHWDGDTEGMYPAQNHGISEAVARPRRHRERRPPYPHTQYFEDGQQAASDGGYRMNTTDSAMNAGVGAGGFSQTDSSQRYVYSHGPPYVPSHMASYAAQAQNTSSQAQHPAGSAYARRLARNHPMAERIEPEVSSSPVEPFTQVQLERARAWVRGTVTHSDATEHVMQEEVVGEATWSEGSEDADDEFDESQDEDDLAMRLQNVHLNEPAIYHAMTPLGGRRF
ncbi:uncharacterized protein LAESUDRAFT_285768 [Laetiporus sulphureus 93-53]|uniref:Uncharacterized protein n=1 Tax=Laetiporus sulphureus 93-53 TaxID=1314785 RepID=A0A165DGM9_9APHY|nr:uncharacterized protein LAESUDRAFT_285768 [Laetiporus sulphureus 93-53]KZT04842.1 hypothetical protein LAESUDRAFT_285768 [Laetiporus sulphureus 93-53]